MITIGEEQHLGRKAFWLLAAKRMSPGGFILLASLVLVLAQGKVSAILLHTLPTQAVSLIASYSYILLASFVLALILLALGFAISWLEYKNYAFTFEEYGFKLRRGIIDRKEFSFPYRQMQNVDVERSLSYQMLGLSRLVIMTAGHEESSEEGMVEASLEPIDKELAEEVRTLLESRIGVQMVSNSAVAPTPTNG